MASYAAEANDIYTSHRQEMAGRLGVDVAHKIADDAHRDVLTLPGISLSSGADTDTGLVTFFTRLLPHLEAK